MPMIEATGMVEDLSLHIALESIKSFSTWAYPEMTLSFNFPVSLLRRADIPDVLTTQAVRWGVSPDRIIIEVTETEMVLNDAALATVTRLRLRGFRLAIDDFGAGASGLLRLKVLPFSELKIDREFVDGVHKNAMLYTICAHAVHLGLSLNMNIIAEGVECAEDLELITKLGCHKIQGYYFSRPISETEMQQSMLTAEWRIWPTHTASPARASPKSLPVL